MRAHWESQNDVSMQIVSAGRRKKEGSLVNNDGSFSSVGGDVSEEAALKVSSVFRYLKEQMSSPQNPLVN